MSIKALIFDFDGLILDTESPLYAAWSEIFLDYGFSLPLEKYAACIGADINSFDPAEYLAEITGNIFDRENLHNQVNRRSSANLHTQPLQEGITQLLNEAKSLGLKMAVASSSERKWVIGNLEERDLIGYFDVIRTAEDVDRVKPDPALYLAALAGLGLQPHEAIAFEDSHNGVTAALAAGIICYAIPNPLTHFMDFSHANQVLTSLIELPLHEIIHRAEDGYKSRKLII